MPDSYIAFVVSLMFVAGLGLIVVQARQKARERKQWKGVPATKKRARS
ncbi:MAG: hypothetical protein LAO03_02190 [Acidobacteriia bacterium]|nr:hypothetical protein [Terriglobia bacterium]